MWPQLLAILLLLPLSILAQQYQFDSGATLFRSLTDSNTRAEPLNQNQCPVAGLDFTCRMGSVQEDPHFRVIQQFTPDYTPSRFTQYESKRTGMRAVVVDQEGPKLYGFFLLATETHDDAGLPHTLEHLCFMGSRSYRYKGFLDKLATRAYSRTNAWTAVDHTAYTLDTAGWAGFAQMLPVYLEHVILPTLTDAGCVTEVHHIDGEGNDAGVVYSEMQGTCNNADELIWHRANRIIYPAPIGFRYETGGMLKDLRGLTADRIRGFHGEMYQPKNFCLALFGEVDHEHLLKILNEFESTILGDIPSPDDPFKRPWVDSDPVPDLPESVVEVVEFPEEDESSGQILIVSLGPDCNDDLMMAALQVIMLYLCGSSAAVLDNNLVEKEQLASGIYFNLGSRPKTEISFTISGVETEKLAAVEGRFFEILREAMSKDLDMSFMKDCIDRQVRTFKFEVEASSSAFSDYVVTDFIFGKRDGSGLRGAATLDEYRTLATWDQEKWRSLIKQYISEAKHVSILGRPSATLSVKLKEEEAKRVEKQKADLGPTGLKEMQDRLDRAKEENDREIPPELLAGFRIPPTDSIHFVKTSSARSGPALEVGRPTNKYQAIVDADSSGNPLFLDFEHIPSNFVRVSLLINTATLPLELRPLLSVYMDAFFGLPLNRDGKTIDFEQVVVELERDTVGYDIDGAGDYGNSESLRIIIQVEREKYLTAIDWLRALAWESIFDIQRLQAITARLLASIPEMKRKGSSMLGGVVSMVHLDPKSIDRSRSPLVQGLYLKRIQKLLKSDPQAVISKLEDLRSHLFAFSNFRVLVIADLDKVKDPVTSWKHFYSKLDTRQPLLPLQKRLDLLSEAGKNPGSLAYVVPMATVDSSFASSIAIGPKSFDDPDRPALMVALAYMNAVEGPLWVAVRGTGLAYGTTMSQDVNSGHVALEIYRSPDAYKAFLASKKILEDHINGVVPFDPLMLEGAISTMVVGFANEQDTLPSAAQGTFIRQVMYGLAPDYMDTLLRKVRAVTVDEIKAVLKSIVLNLFTPGKADVVVTCAPGLKEVRTIISGSY